MLLIPLRAASTTCHQASTHVTPEPGFTPSLARSLPWCKAAIRNCQLPTGSITPSQATEGCGQTDNWSRLKGKATRALDLGVEFLFPLLFLFFCLLFLALKIKSKALSVLLSPCPQPMLPGGFTAGLLPLSHTSSPISMILGELTSTELYSRPFCFYFNFLSVLICCWFGWGECLCMCAHQGICLEVRWQPHRSWLCSSTVWVPGIELRLSFLDASAFSCWGMPPALFVSF